VIAFSVFACSVFGAADDTKRQRPAERPPASAQDESVPVYKPPQRGAPGGRVGGGTRGTPGRDIFVLSVLAPDHTGLTLKEQPSLFWSISAPTALPVAITIVDPNAVEPLLEMEVPGPVLSGVHRVRLADFGVRLAPGVPYQWSVAVIPDRARRSRDILASATIERVASDGGGVITDDLREVAARHAQAGIWYDALEAICDRIERSPGDATAKRHRAALLAQVGLPELVE
jgi:hypothetical protein